MESNAIATIPLGTLVLMAALLVVAGLITGWAAAHSRQQRWLARANQIETGCAQALLNVLPYAALVVDAGGAIIAHNKESTPTLAAFGRGDTVPLTIDAAIGRVIRSRVSETLELLSPGSEQQLQVSIAPLSMGTTAVPYAFVLFHNPAASSDRAQVYQQLISAIGHELRTPLTAIMGHADIISSCQVEEEALWRRSLTFVTAEVERLARLVEDLLHLSRLDLAPPHLRPANLRLIAEEALSTLFDAAQKQNATLMLQAANELPRVQADADRIRQVFLNLIDNAIKYAPDSTVAIQLTPKDDTVQVEVRDTGPGIAADELAHIFEPFHRGRRDSAALGTGLGLTIVKSILDQHNAPIRVDSQPGQGARFTFSLPVTK